MYFYELHEGDEDVFSDVLLARDDEMDPDEFFELVEAVRHQVQDTYVDDTLIEAIAAELQREHGFIFVSDDRLTAAVNVSTVDEENFIVAIDTDDEAAEDERGADYRAVIARVRPDRRGRPRRGRAQHLARRRDRRARPTPATC